ncbi:MAG: hypothetical protein U0Q15_00515 [Kineosporiaceae bacterium]
MTYDLWPLQQAELLELDDRLVGCVGLPGISDRPPDSVLFSRGVRTVFAALFDARRPLFESGLLGEAQQGSPRASRSLLMRLPKSDIRAAPTPRPPPATEDIDRVPFTWS